MDAAATNEFRLLINGKLVQGAARLDVINPATGKVLTTCARADAAQLQDKIVNISK
jgi:acyl-CoA reductase-like NAD-dependent aldehyde dehydrogenase